MICVETIGKIRRWHRVDKLSISKIARRLSASRNTIAKYLAGEVTQPKYKTRVTLPGFNVHRDFGNVLMNGERNGQGDGTESAVYRRV